MALQERSRSHSLQRHPKRTQHSDSSTLKKHSVAATRSASLQRHHPAAAPAGQLHSAHTILTAAPGSSTPAPKRTHHSNSSTLQRQPAGAPASQLPLTAAPCSGTAAPPTCQLKAHTPPWQRHREAALCSSTLHRHQQASSKAHPILEARTPLFRYLGKNQDMLTDPPAKREKTR